MTGLTNLGRAGKNIRSAALEACRRRFRAIIMTSLSTMIAMVPLLIGNIGPGAGEGSRLAVGATIFGGMLISTFFHSLCNANNVCSSYKKY